MLTILRVLALVGRYGTQAFAGSLFVGLALPQLAAFARPVLPVTIFVFLLTTFVRVRPTALLGLTRRPGTLLLTWLCVLLVPAALVGCAMAAFGRASIDPGFLLGLAILAASPPIMSSPAVALMLGIEPVLVVATVLLLTIAAPVTAPLLAGAVVGAAIPLEPSGLVLRLLGLVGGAIASAVVLRRLCGLGRIERHAASLDGIAVSMYLIFAVAAMDGVPAAIVGDPAGTATLLGAAIALSLAGYGTSWLILRPVPPAERLVLGYATGQRNMGLLVAALGASAPQRTYLFFALAQFPIYLAPILMGPLAKRFVAAGRR